MSPKEDEEDEEDEEANASCDPVTTPPASCAMTIPAHTSHAQHPISLKKRLVQSHNILKEMARGGNRETTHQQISNSPCATIAKLSAVLPRERREWTILPLVTPWAGLPARRTKDADFPVRVESARSEPHWTERKGHFSKYKFTNLMRLDGSVYA